MSRTVRVPGAPAGGRPRELEVYGQDIGTGGATIAVATEDLRRQAVVVRHAAEVAREAGASTRAAAAALRLTQSFATGGPALLEETVLLATAVDRGVQDIEAFAAQLEATADRYEATERAAAATVGQVPAVAGLLAGPLLGPLGGTTWSMLVAYVMAQALGQGQHVPTAWGTGVLAEALAASVLPWSQDPVRDLATLLTRSVPQLTADDVLVRQVDAPGVVAAADGVPATTTQAAVDGVEGVMGAIAGVTPFNGGQEGTIRLDRVVADDGAVSWLVVVPGTQMDVDGPLTGVTTSGNPFTAVSNVAAVVGASTASSALVVQAMRQAGVRRDEPVVIAGHSQGGMVALNVANQVQEEFEVVGVVTAGSPVGLLESPEGTSVLSLEHTEDGVHGFDNSPNPISESWTTVSRTLAADDDPAIAGGTTWSHSHDPLVYADTGAEVDASSAPELVEFLDRVSPVLNGSATSTSSYFHGYLRATVPSPVPGVPDIPLPPGPDDV